MPDLRRHQLVHLSEPAWARLLDEDRDAQALACLSHWAGRGLPLVVATQHDARGDTVALGLPAPSRWGRLRIAVAMARSGIVRVGHFPVAEDVAGLLPLPVQAHWGTLARALRALGAVARVHGSHGWQCLTGLDHLREGSDLDLCVGVDDASMADAAAALLARFPVPQPRLDGELMFADGAAVSWREWAAWRAGRTASLLVRRLHGVGLASDLDAILPAPAGQATA